nr:hypothetical protein [Acrocarpospora macrocephala]
MVARGGVQRLVQARDGEVQICQITGTGEAYLERAAQVIQACTAAGVILRSDLDGLLVGDYGLIQIGRFAHARVLSLKHVAERTQDRCPVWVIRQDAVDGLPLNDDGLVQIGPIAGESEPHLERVAKIGQPAGVTGMIEWGCLHGLAQAGDGLLQIGWAATMLEPHPQRATEATEHRRMVRVIGFHGLTQIGDGQFQIRRIAAALEPFPQRDTEVGQESTTGGVIGRSEVGNALPQPDATFQQIRISRVQRLVEQRDRMRHRLGGQDRQQRFRKILVSDLGQKARAEHLGRGDQIVLVLSLGKRLIAVPMPPAEHTPRLKILASQACGQVPSIGDRDSFQQR